MNVLVFLSCLSLLQGIQFLLENDLLQNTPEDIAQFLYKGEGLNKTVIGDYLGERWGRQSSLHEIYTHRCDLKKQITACVD